MDSSTSSSEVDGFVRAVPHQPWRRVVGLAAILVVVGVAAWEAAMRRAGLHCSPASA
jgi:hypothetical protein